MPGLSLSRSLAQQQKRRLSAAANLLVNQPTLAMSQTLEKTVLVEKLPDSRTAHLLPIIEFFKSQGNTPWLAPSYRPVGDDGFDFDRDGFGNFYFDEPLDLTAVEMLFSFPSTIVFTQDRGIWDRRNLVGISQAKPVTDVLSFD